MSDTSANDRLRAVFQQVLGPLPQDVGGISRESMPVWDSLKHVDLIFAVEDEFGVTFSEEEMAELKTFVEFQSVIGARS